MYCGGYMARMFELLTIRRGAQFIRFKDYNIIQLQPIALDKNDFILSEINSTKKVTAVFKVG